MVGSKRILHERRFDSMVQRYKSYPLTTISSLSDPRLRTIVFGGMEALQERQVVQAFRILYADVLPVRMAGNFLFDQLDETLTRESNLQEESVEFLVNKLQFTDDERKEAFEW